MPLFVSVHPAWRGLVAGLGLGLGTLLVAGIPTAVIPTPWFTRMVPTRPQDYVFLALAALLAAALGATYAVPATCPIQPVKIGGGAYLAALAVGCPICNKLVVLLLGVSGALTVFQPLQPILAFAGIALLASALALRLRAMRAYDRTRPQDLNRHRA